MKLSSFQGKEMLNRWRNMSPPPPRLQLPHTGITGAQEGPTGLHHNASLPSVHGIFYGGVTHEIKYYNSSFTLLSCFPIRLVNGGCGFSSRVHDFTSVI